MFGFVSGWYTPLGLGLHMRLGGVVLYLVWGLRFEGLVSFVLF